MYTNVIHKPFKIPHLIKNYGRRRFTCTRTCHSTRSICRSILDDIISSIPQ